MKRHKKNAQESIQEGQESLKKMLKTLEPYLPRTDIGLPERQDTWKQADDSIGISNPPITRHAIDPV